jgi:hypothetical protein
MLMINKRSFLALVLGALFSSHSLALPNENFKVSQVDVTKTLGIVWVDLSGKTITSQPTCNGQNYGAVTCELKEDYCKSVISLALTAKSTDGEVDFQYDGLCLGSFATGNRFRLSY